MPYNSLDTKDAANTQYNNGIKFLWLNSIEREREYLIGISILNTTKIDPSDTSNNNLLEKCLNKVNIDRR